jgi:hypothetical protein
VIPALGRMKQENGYFKCIVDYTVRPYLKRKPKQKEKDQKRKEMRGEKSLLNLTFLLPGGTGVRTQGFTLARKVFNCLSHTSSPFCSGYFRDRVLIFIQTGLDSDPPILGFPQ